MRGLFWRDSGGEEYELTKVAPTEDEIVSTFEIRKTDDAKQMVFGWASVAKDAAGNLVEDRQGDLIDPGDLEDAAYLFTLNFREGDEMHTDEVKMQLVESFVVTPEKLEKMGLAPDALPQGWWTGFHIPDRDYYEKARDSYPMFSIAGVAMAEEVA